MRWMVGLLLLTLLGHAMAQEEEPPLVEWQHGDDAYDRAIVRFNKNIKKFSSWDAFKAKILSTIAPDTPGNCYELTGDAVQPVEITRVHLQKLEGKGWRKTSGKGWRQKKKDRTFREYRVNEKAGVLLRIDGVKPRFFFAKTKRICEFPL